MNPRARAPPSHRHSRCSPAAPKREAILQPALDYYQHEEQLGAQATSFRFGYAYALYVSSIAGGDDPAKRRVALAAAAKLLDSTPAEAKAPV